MLIMAIGAELITGLHGKDHRDAATTTSTNHRWVLKTYHPSAAGTPSTTIVSKMAYKSTMVIVDASNPRVNKKKYAWKRGASPLSPGRSCPRVDQVSLRVVASKNCHTR